MRPNVSSASTTPSEQVSAVQTNARGTATTDRSTALSDTACRVGKGYLGRDGTSARGLVGDADRARRGAGAVALRGDDARAAARSDPLPTAFRRKTRAPPP